MPLSPAVGPPAGSIGVSGGGGLPRLALVVDVLAVLASRLTPLGFGMFIWFVLAPVVAALLLAAAAAVEPNGGG